MNIYKLDALSAITLLFVGAFLWQFLMHRVRFRMIKYYLKKKYVFKLHDSSHKISTANKIMLQSRGILYMGQPVNGTQPFTFPKIVNGFYLVVVYFIPFFFFFIINNYFFYEARLTPHFERGDDLTLLLLVFFSVTPHLWYIYFNIRRYKYFFLEKEGKATWGNDVLAYDSHN